MKYKTSKQIRKNLRYYRINFGFIEPFTILLDGNFIKKCMDKDFNFRQKIEKYTQASRINIQTTSCVIRELDSLGLREVFDTAKTLKQLKCKHEPPLNPRACLLKLLNRTNKKQYMIATQDAQFKKSLQKIKGVPLFHFEQEKFTMSDPSYKNQSTINEKEKKKLLPTDQEMKAIKQVQQELELEKQLEKQQQKQMLLKECQKLCIQKKAPKKGPNPLSIKSKRVKKQPQIYTQKTKKTRCRSKLKN